MSEMGKNVMSLYSEYWNSADYANDFNEVAEPLRQEFKLLKKVLQDTSNSEEISEMFFDHVKEGIDENFGDEKFQPDLAKVNRKNLEEVISVIKQNPKLDIFSDDFKKIVRIPIVLPYIYHGVLSGAFVFLVAFENQHFYYDDPAKDDIYFQKYKRFFSDNASYTKQIERTLGLKITSHMKKEHQKKDTSLYEVCEIYDYIVNVYLKNFRSDIVSKYFDRPHTEPFFKRGFGLAESKIWNEDTNEIWNAWNLFKSILVGKMSEPELLKFRAFNKSLYGVLASLLLLRKTVFEFHLPLIHFTEKIVSSWSVNSVNSLEKCSDKLIQIMITANYHLDKKIEYTKQNILNDKNFYPIEISSQEELYFLMLFRTITKEILSHIHIRMNELRVQLNSLGSFEQMLRYWSKEYALTVIGISNWKEFYRKYKTQLKNIFPNNSKEENKKLWLISLSLLRYVHQERFNFLGKNESISQKPEEWNQQTKEEIARFRVYDIFPMMKFVENSKTIFVQTSGKNTKKYSGIIGKNTDDKKTTKPLFNILKNFDTHGSDLLVEQIKDFYLSQAGQLLLDEEVTKNALDLELNLYKIFEQTLLLEIPDYRLHYWITVLNSDALNIFLEMKDTITQWLNTIKSNSTNRSAQ